MKKLLIKLVLTIIPILLIGNIAYADYSEDISEIQEELLQLDNKFMNNKEEAQGELQKKTLDLDNTYIEDKKDIIEEYESNKSDLESTYGEDLNDSFSDYQDKYGENITWEAFFDSPEFQALLQEYENNKTNLLETKEENLSKAQDKYDNDLEKFTQEYNKKIEELTEENTKERFELEEKLREAQYNQEKEQEINYINKRIKELEEELSKTDDPDKQSQLIAEIEELKKLKAEIEGENYTSPDSYEEQQEKEQEEIDKQFDTQIERLEALIETKKAELTQLRDLNEITQLTLEIAELEKELARLINNQEEKSNEENNNDNNENDHNSTYKPSLIPQPDFIPGTNSSTNRNSLTSSILPRIGIAIIGFAGVISLLILIWAGVRMMIAWGEEDDYTKAKDQIIFAIIGLVISLLSYTIVKAIINFKIEEKSSTEITEIYNA